MIQELVEHWDDLQVTIIFTQLFNHAIEFYAAEIAATGIKGPGDFTADRGWTKKGASSNLDLVYDPHDAEQFVRGSIKWDGCQNIHFGSEGYMHLCGSNDVERLSQFLIRVFNKCGELMGDKVLEDTFPARVK